jgi:hypothetical protein
MTTSKHFHSQVLTYQMVECSKCQQAYTLDRPVLLRNAPLTPCCGARPVPLIVPAEQLHLTSPSWIVSLQHVDQNTKSTIMQVAFIVLVVIVVLSQVL